MATYQQELQKLTGPQRDAAGALISLFSQYGLQGLAGEVIKFIKQGFSSDTISLMLEETPVYKQRFAANDARVKRGMAKLSPKEYIEVERAYGQVMRASGMPSGFYDSRQDFQKFIEGDLSPAELNERVGAWQDVAKSDAGTLSELGRLYGMDASSYAAYLLNPGRATPLLKKQAQAIQFAGAGRRHGFLLTRALADQYGQNQGITAEKAEAGFTAIQEVQPATEKLGSVYGDTYTVEDSVKEMFGGDAVAGEKRKKIASKERATFGGSSRGSTGKSKGSSY